MVINDLEGSGASPKGATVATHEPSPAVSALPGECQLAGNRLNPTWDCKIGVRGSYPLRPGADLPMRRAVEAAFEQIVGVEAEFNFSGWGAQLTEPELAVVENRLPSEEHHLEWLARETGPELLAALKALHHAVCGDTGFATAVRGVTGTPYPWPALDAADELALAAIAKATGAA